MSEKNQAAAAALRVLRDALRKFADDMEQVLPPLIESASDAAGREEHGLLSQTGKVRSMMACVADMGDLVEDAAQDYATRGEEDPVYAGEEAF